MMNLSRCWYHRLAQLRLDVEQNAILQHEQIDIRQDASLRIEEERIAALSRLQLAHLVRRHGVQQAGAIFAGRRNPATRRQIQISRRFPQSLISRVP